MYELIDSMVKAMEKDAVVSKNKPKNAQTLRKAITELAAQENAKVPAERRVTQRDVETVAARSLNKTAGLERSSRYFAAYKDVASFITLATTGNAPTRLTTNRDLLPVGHPLSTRKHAMTASAYSETVARWIAADPRIHDDARSLVASVYMLSPGSVEYSHALTRLESLEPGMVPRDMLIFENVSAITAAGFGRWLVNKFGGGNSSIARSLRAKKQLRDREGQFAEQGGGMQFYVRLADGTIKSKVGSHAGNAENGTDFLVEISGDPDIEDGIYSVPANITKAVKAIIPGDDAGGVSLPEGVDAVDVANLQRKDVPDGWKLIKEKGEGETGPDKVYATDDGYEVEYWAAGNYGNPELQKAYQFNKGLMTEVPGQPVGNFTSRVDAQGRLNMQAKFEKERPFFALYRVETPETKRQAVVMAQRWSDVQEAAEADQDKFEKYYDAAEKNNADKKEKQEKAAAESKAFIEAQKKKEAEQKKINDAERADILSNFDKGLDQFGNKIPDGWDLVLDDIALNPFSGGIQKEKVASFRRSDQGYSAQVAYTPGGKLKGLYQDQEFDNWNDLEQGFAENVEADVKARRDAVLDIVEPYDPDGEIRSMIENGASGEEILEKLRENEKWKSKENDLDTSWAVDLPSAGQKKSWKEFEEQRAAVANLPKEFEGVTPAKPGLRRFKPANQVEVGEKIINSEGNEGTVTAVKPDMTSIRISTDTDTKNGKFYKSYDLIEVVTPTKKEEEAPAIRPLSSDDKVVPLQWAQIAEIGSDGKPKLKDIVQRLEDGVVFDRNDGSILFVPPVIEIEEGPKGSESKKSVSSETLDFFDLFPNAVKREDIRPLSPDDDVRIAVIAQIAEEGPDGIFRMRNLVERIEDGVIFDKNNGEIISHPDGIIPPDLVDEKQDEAPATQEPEAEEPETPEDDEGEEGPGGTPPTEPEPTAPAPAAPAQPAKKEEPEDIEWILPDGAFNLYRADEYEPEGRIDQESPDYTDDPKVLANKFSAEELKDALAQAIIGVKDYATEFLDELMDLDDEDEEEGAKKKPGPKKKKPKSKQATGFGQLDFAYGDEFVPAEAIYSALKEQGEDAEMIAAELYDLPLGESKNVDMLEGLRSPEEVRAQEPSVVVDDFDQEEAMDVANANIDVARGEGAEVAAAAVLELEKNGEPNPYINDIATDLNSTGVDTDMQGMLDKYIALALSDDEDENQAYRALHALLLSADGGLSIPGEETMLRTAIFDALKKYNGSDPSPEEVEAIFEKYGYYPQLIASKKAFVDGLEGLEDKNSIAGAFYRLMAAGGVVNTKPQYRGIQVTLGSEDLEKMTNQGGFISFDGRSFSDDKAMAGKFAGAFGGNEDKAAVIFTVDAGKGKFLDITKVSPFPDERESLMFGNFRIADVQVKVNPAGKTLYNVKLEALDNRSQVLEGFDDDYKPLLIENEQVELPEAYYSPAAEAFEPIDLEGIEDQDELDAAAATNPLYIARAYEVEDLIGAFRGAIEDGTGKVQLIDDDKEYTADVEAIRDALQIQGIDTNEVLKDVANAEPDVEAEDVDEEPIEPVADSPLAQIIEEFGQEYDLENFEQVGPQQGSNKGGTFKDAEGNEYYVKEPKSELHRRNELLASAFYKLLGVNAAEMRFGSGDDGVEKIFSTIIPGQLLADVQSLSPETKKQIQEGFAVDAWLANWDVAGLVNDNIIVDEDGNAFRIDTGGSLLFRAMGAPKGKLFGNEVNELDSLRNPKMNASSAALFGDMTDEDIKNSAAKLLDISHSDIDELVDATLGASPEGEELKDKLKARRQFILEKYGLLGDDTSLIAETTKTDTPEPGEAENYVVDFDPLGADDMFEGVPGLEDEDPTEMSEEEALQKWLEAYGLDKLGVKVVEITREDFSPRVQFEIPQNAKGAFGEAYGLDLDENLGDGIDKVTPGTTKTDTPEQPVTPTPEVPSEAPGNPYVTSDGVPIEPGMKLRYKKTGEVVDFVKYDKGNSSYVYVKMADGSIKVKSTKQLESVNGGGGDSGGGGGGGDTGGDSSDDPGYVPFSVMADSEGKYPNNWKDAKELYENGATQEEIFKKMFEGVDSIKGQKFKENYTNILGTDLTDENSIFAQLPNDADIFYVGSQNAFGRDADGRWFIYDGGGEPPISYLDEEPDASDYSEFYDDLFTTDEDGSVIFADGAFYDSRLNAAWGPQEGDDGGDDGGDGGGPKDDGPEPTEPGPTDTPQEQPESTEPTVIDTTGTVEDAVKVIQNAIDNNKLITFKYNGKVRNFKPMSIWENPKNGKINVYGEDLGDGGKKKNFTVQLIEALPDTDPNKPEAVEAQTPEAEPEPKKLQFHAQWVKDIMASKGVPISDEKAVEIRDKIDENWEVDWSQANDSDVIDALDEVLGPDWNEAVGNTDFESDDVEDPLISDEQRQIIIDKIQKLAGIEGFPTEKFVNQISDPSLTEADGAQILEELEQYDSEIGDQPKVQAPSPSLEDLEEMEGDEAEEEAPALQPGAEVTDKKGNKGTVLKGPNKDNYVFVQFEDGKTGWRSAGSVSTTGEFNEGVKKAAPKKVAGKITPAGTKAVFVENPGGWDTSDFENVPALSDAIALVQNPDDKFAAMKGASAAIDADSIEDLDVRIMRVRNQEGTDGLRLKFKLTSWAGNARVKELMDMTPDELKAAGITKDNNMTVDRIDVGPDGIGQISKDKNAYQGSGVTWTITTPEGVVVKIYRANYDATSKVSATKYSSSRSFHNLVQIQAPADATNEQIADALKKAGVSDVRPATKADAQILVENRLMSIFDGKVDATKNPKGKDREDSLARIKAKYGITPDDVVITTGASGRIETRLSPEGAKKIVDATGSPTAIQHNITIPGFYGQSDEFEKRTDWIARLIGTPQGGLLSTTTRWTEGIGASGMSSAADVGTGGADYVFTKPVKVADAKTYGTGGVLMYFDPVKVYQRLDFYANSFDAFGKRQANQDVINAAKVGAYELMFKHRLSFDDLDSIVVSNQATRTAVIQKLRQMGINEIGGRPLEAVIIIGSQVKV